MRGAEKRDRRRGRPAAARRGARPPPTTDRPAPSAAPARARPSRRTPRSRRRGGRAPSGRHRTACRRRGGSPPSSRPSRRRDGPASRNTAARAAAARSASAKAGARLTPVDRHLRHAGDDLGRGDAQQRRGWSGRCRWRGRTGRASRRPAVDPGRPVHDQRVAHAAAVGVLLVPFQRRVAGLGPAPGDVAVAVGAADVVQPLHRLVDVLADAVEPLHLVEHAGLRRPPGWRRCRRAARTGCCPTGRPTSGS